MNKKDRFLMYRPLGRDRFGYMHNLSNILALCAEAAHLGRSVILSAPDFDPSHNFGIPVNKHWDNYIDLNNITVNILSTENLICDQSFKIPVFRHDNFPIHSFSPTQIGIVRNTQDGSSEENQVKTLLIRELSPEFNLWGSATPDIQDQYCVNINPSTTVSELASSVVDALLPSYIALHIRRGDRLKQNPLIDKYTKGEFVRVFIEENCGPRPHNIFLMSDEREPSFFEVLKTYFSLNTYLDFPNLSSLVQYPAPDNYMLFCIEKLIYYKAAIRIGVFTDSDSIDYSLSPYSMHYIYRRRFQRVYNALDRLLNKATKKIVGIPKRLHRLSRLNLS